MMLKLCVLVCLMAPTAGLSAQEEAKRTQKALSLIGDSLASIEQPGSARDIALNALLKNVAGATRVTPAERDVLDNVSGILEDVLELLRGEKVTNQAMFGTLKTDIEACLALDPDVETNEGVAKDSAQATHLSCRHSEMTALNEIDGLCWTALTTVTSQACFKPDDMPQQGVSTPGFVSDINFLTDNIHISNWEDWFEDARDHFAAVRTNWATTVESCTNRFSEHTTLRGQCVDDQTTFETAYCLYQTAIDDQCTARWDCYEGRACEYKGRLQAFVTANDLNLNQARVVMYVKCLVDDVLLADTNVDDPDSTCTLQAATDSSLNEYRAQLPDDIHPWPACSTAAVNSNRLSAVDYGGNFSSGGSWEHMVSNPFTCTAADGSSAPAFADLPATFDVVVDLRC